MLLSITTRYRPATDLGYLVHKNPSSHYTTEIAFGHVHVVYPEASEECCTVSVLVDVDPISLVRTHRGAMVNEFALSQYVNDRPYATSSLMSVALSKVFGTAMAGRSKERPNLVDTPIPLEVSLPVTPCRGGARLVRRIFEPLGYLVGADAIPLDPRFPDWGDSRYMDVTLSAEVTLKSLLTHLYVLLPVLDDDKHYWVGSEEIEKLIHRAGDWLVGHPERELITRRYLRHDRQLTSEALSRLMEDDTADSGAPEPCQSVDEASIEGPINLKQQRIDAVLEIIRANGARRILDLGCGEGRLLAELLREPGIEQVVGLDVSHRVLEQAAKRLYLDTMAPRQRSRVELLQGSITYRDSRLVGFDAAAVIEVIEHLDRSRLDAFERMIFAYARPSTVIITTPNSEYNVRFLNLPAGEFRHRDHRFEWTRSEFADWCQQVAHRRDYSVTMSGIGSGDPEFGSPTQMAVFTR